MARKNSTRSARKSTAAKRDNYQIITDRILEALEAGTVPWVKPWRADASGFPRNGHSKRPYNGINVLLLWLTAQQLGYASNDWFTFKQAKELGGHVRKGEHGTTIVFWNILQKKERDASGDEVERKIPLLRLYTVFNRNQIDGLPEPAVTAEPRPITERCEDVRVFVEDALGARVSYNGNVAAYSPHLDNIRMPKREQFESDEFFCGTLLHEVGHWTGHRSRMDRLARTGDTYTIKFGSYEYMEEELVAELFSAFMCAEMHISSTLRHAEYIGAWIKKLNEDNRIIFRASSAAKRACDFAIAAAGGSTNGTAEDADQEAA